MICASCRRAGWALPPAWCWCGSGITASGVIFASLEDETGLANIIVWPKVFEANRRTVLGARMMAVTGQVQKEGLQSLSKRPRRVSLLVLNGTSRRIGSEVARRYGNLGR